MKEMSSEEWGGRGSRDLSTAVIFPITPTPPGACWDHLSPEKSLVSLSLLCLHWDWKMNLVESVRRGLWLSHLTFITCCLSCMLLYIHVCSCTVLSPGTTLPPENRDRILILDALGFSSSGLQCHSTNVHWKPAFPQTWDTAVNKTDGPLGANWVYISQGKEHSVII